MFQNIPGLMVLDVPGAHLVARLHARIDKYKSRAVELRAKLDKITDKLKNAQVQAIEDDTLSSFVDDGRALGRTPLLALRRAAAMLEEQADWSKFLADHIVSETVYKLTLHELRDLVGSRGVGYGHGELLEHDEFFGAA